MNNLNQWAIKWRVPFEAVEDLRRVMGTINTDPVTTSGVKSEAAVQALVRLEATRKGKRMWRNNVGAAHIEGRGVIRFGLCNDSKQMNKKIKSSDLIGVSPVLITSAHVGQIIGQFIAREIKPEGWQYSETEHEQAQLKFIQLVMSLGGDAAFATSEGSL